MSDATHEDSAPAAPLSGLPPDGSHILGDLVADLKAVVARLAGENEGLRGEVDRLRDELRIVCVVAGKRILGPARGRIVFDRPPEEYERAGRRAAGLKVEEMPAAVAPLPPASGPDGER